MEVNHEGVWRPVCDDEWDKNDGHVVCRQLGYPGGSLAVRIQQFTGGTRDFSLSELQCTGDEESLCLCPAKRENINCYPYEGVFVACACELIHLADRACDYHVTINVYIHV